MSKRMCSQCGKTYSVEEYSRLERQPVNSEDEDPSRGSGYEKVCGECGHGFFSEKWSLRETVDTDEGEVTVSTVGLVIPHGTHYTDWFETCVFHDHGSEVVCRYETKDEARSGHDDIVEAVKSGQFRREPVGYRLVIGDE